MKANPEWLARLEETPQAQATVIIHTKDDPRQHTASLEAHGLTVTFAFRLTKTIAAKGAAYRILDLLQEPWIVKIEPDQKITTMK